MRIDSAIAQYSDANGAQMMPPSTPKKDELVNAEERRNRKNRRKRAGSSAQARPAGPTRWVGLKSGWR